MDRHQAEQVLPPPSSSMSGQAPPNLTIRTSTQPPALSTAAQHASSSSPPDPSQSGYPKRIPIEKQEKALRLYIDYQSATLEEELARREPQSATTFRDGYYLTVPVASAPHSVTSRTSSRRRRAISVSTSACGAVTDMSSVMSFDGKESPSSAKPRAQPEFTTFDGKKLKQRVRSRLSPKAKAKAALVRWLGSCPSCHKRRVPCPLQHHDIDTLKKLHQAMPPERPPYSPSNHQSCSSVSGISQRSGTSSFAGQRVVGVSQTDALMGLGQNEQLLKTSADCDIMDIQSPGGGLTDPLAEISASGTPYQTFPDLSSPYSQYQDGDMFPLGVRRGFFYCQHLDGSCFARFEDPESLQFHFEIAHFSFTRIKPAHRFVCSNCQRLNNMDSAPCYNCGAQGLIELWIYGNFIRTPPYHRSPPDDQDLRMKASISGFLPPYGAPTVNPQMDPDLNNGHFNGDIDPSSYDFDTNNMYGGSDFGSQNFDFDSQDRSPSSNNHFQGAFFRTAKQVAEHITHVSQTSRITTAIGKIYDQKASISFALLLVMAIAFGFTYESAMVCVQRALALAAATFHTHSPAIGFMSILFSFAMYSSMKHFSIRRGQRAPCVRIPPRLRLFDRCANNGLVSDSLDIPLSTARLGSRLSAGRQRLALISTAGMRHYEYERSGNDYV
ncbi:uncharacterized protein BP5553_01577 [Venustampulla echinocandica]|uniref:Uncharacterized protein n=1 Tax=Venustampulla echinocandica TaxID=2656787 RepID=A0A370U1F1_9HELO|nr:uncharacterized protein BP5553_01577 [Venustampulla echinocandica]RDL41598.1 hypothetical protein BP5553_01577 [Venustampulla echinocandica]